MSRRSTKFQALKWVAERQPVGLFPHDKHCPRLSTVQDMVADGLLKPIKRLQVHPEVSSVARRTYRLTRKGTRWLRRAEFEASKTQK